jgi:pyruvate ferredoxin oxidoreductase alpha subunit
MTRLLLSGNEAAALAAKLARVKVIAAYPITPQTAVMEKLSEYVADGELDAEIIRVESEHSALSACIGAAASGVRVFTATSSQGLMLMSEILFVASGMRLPIVMVNVNRSLSAPLSIWCDQQDSLSVRDAGWIQMYCENNQEILDFVIQAFRIAERTLLPVMVCYDGYILSHMAEMVEVPEQEAVDEFLPPYRYPYALDPKKPVTLGPVGVPEYYQEFKFMQHSAMLEARKEIEETMTLFGQKFGRKYKMIETYGIEDANVVLVSMGSVCGTIKEVIDALRKGGEKVGLVEIKVFRPFLHKELSEILSGKKVIGVVEKALSLGATGPLYADLATVFEGRLPTMIDFICGLGGRDVREGDIREAIKICHAAARGEKIEKMIWLGLREKVVGP